MNRRDLVAKLTAAASLPLAAALAACTERPKEVRLLGWIGYDEEDLLRDFTAKTGIKVRVKTFIGGTEMLSILSASPNEFDVVVLDPEFVRRAVSSNLLDELNPADYDLSSYHPFFLAQDGAVQKTARIDGRLYAIPARYGLIGLMYNRDRVSEADMESFGALWNPKYKGRIAAFAPLWQPLMGVVSLSLGNSGNPYDLTGQQLLAVEERLKSLRKEQQIALHQSVPSLLDAFKSGTAWIMAAGADANAYSLRDNGSIAWSIPREGGIMWTESLGLVKNSKNRDGAVKLIQYLQSAEGQVRLARRSMYISSPPSLTALSMLSEEERRLRKSASRAELDQNLSRVVVRSLPSDEKAWKDAYERFIR